MKLPKGIKRFGLVCMLVLIGSLYFTFAQTELSATPKEIDRGSNWVKIDNQDGTFSKTYSSKQINILQNGTYVPFNKVVNVKFDKKTGDLTYSYKDYSVKLKMFFVIDVSKKVCNQRDWIWTQDSCVMLAPDVRTFMQDNGIKLDIVVEDKKTHYKYGLNITNIPQVYADRLQYVGLQLRDWDNLDLSDIEKIGRSLIIKNRLILDFQDLIDTGYTLQMPDKQTLLIGNVKGKSNLWLDPTVEYNFTDTTDNKAYWFSEQTSTFKEADATGTEFASYTNILTNDGSLYSTTETGSYTTILAQHNFHFTIDEDIDLINQIDILYSGQVGTTDCVSGQTHKVDIHTDSGHENFGTLQENTDADYTLQKTSSISDYLDGNNKMYIRAYSECSTGSTVFIRSDYAEIVITYANIVNFTEAEFNDTIPDSGDTTQLTINVSSPTGGIINEVNADLTYPNGTSLNHTLSIQTTTGIDTTSDLESGTQTHSGENSASSCANNGACADLGDTGTCGACAGCSWFSCPFIFSEKDGLWDRQYEGFSSGAFNFPLVATRHTMFNSECDDGIRKIKIVEALKEESTITELKLYEIESQGTPYRGFEEQTYIFKDHIAPSYCSYNDNDCLNEIKYSDDVQLHTDYQEKQLEDEIYLEFDNYVQSDNLILLIEGGKTDIIHNYYGLAMSMMRNRNLVKFLSKTPIYQSIIKDFMERLSPNIFVWDGEEWINEGSLMSMYSIFHDGTEVIKLDTYNQENVKIKIVGINGGFRYDTINAELREYDFKEEIISPVKMMFNDEEVDTFKQRMSLGDTLELEYSCSENKDVIVEINGYYLTEEGGFHLEEPPNLFTSIKKLYNLFVSKSKYLTEFDQTVVNYSLEGERSCGQVANMPENPFVIIPAVQGACSGTSTCNTYNSDQSSCEGCNICTWNPAVGDTEANKSASAITYSDVSDTSLNTITRVNATITVSTYDKTGSTENGNNDPDLFLQIYNGSNWLDIGDFGVSTTATYSLSTTEASILSAWETEANRDIRVYGIDMDGTVSNTDDIAWTVVDVDIYADIWNQDMFEYDFTDTTQTGQHNLTMMYATTTLDETFSQSFNLNFTVQGDAPADSCDCAGTGTNWEIDLSDYCVIETNCDLTTGNISWINTGNITFNAIIQATHINDLPANQSGWLGSSADIRIKQ